MAQMKKIKLRQSIIPIGIYDEDDNLVLELQFDKSDENIKKFYDAYAEMQVSDGKYKDSIEDTKDYVKKYFDLMLGDGAFDKVYQLNQSIIIVVAYMMEISQYILDELDKDAELDILNKYMKK